MIKLVKLDTTEFLLKIYFYQICRAFQLEESTPYIMVEVEDIKKEYPDFWDQFNFTNINIHELFKFIKIKKGLRFYQIELPEFFYFFGEENEVPFLENQNIACFPKLFDDCEESPYNDLLFMNFIQLNYVYRNNGIYLNISIHCDPYGDELIYYKFIDKNHFSMIKYDLNGSHIVLYKYDKTVTPIIIESIKMIDLLMRRNVEIELNDIHHKYSKNKTVLLKILKNKQYMHSFKLISESLQNDPDFIYNALKVNCNIFPEISEIFKNDKKYIFLAIKKNHDNFRYIEKSLKRNKSFILEALLENYQIYEYLSNSLQNDKDIKKKYMDLCPFMNNGISNYLLFFIYSPSK